MLKPTVYQAYLSDTVAEGTSAMLQLKADVNDVFITHVLRHDDGTEWSREYKERISMLWLAFQEAIDYMAIKNERENGRTN